MSEAIEITGKTVEEALEQALKQLGVTKDQIGYKVIDQPSKGVLGFFSKPAKIQAWILKDEVEDLKPYVLVDVPAEESIESLESTEKFGSIPTVESESDKDLVQGIESFSATVSEENNSLDQIETPREEFSLEDQKPKIERAIEFLQGTFERMKLDVKIAHEKRASNYIINLSGEKLGILIGKHGATLDALQYLTNLSANRNVAYDNRTRFILDVEHYRAKREETLKELADHLAEKVARTGQETKLEPMNRYERKVIHLALQENDKVTTYSEGEEPFRRLIIAPKKK